MSGYLKRLASSVRQTGGPIHPVVAPIFSSPQSTTASQEFLEEIVSTPPALAPHSRRDPPASVPRPSFLTPAHGAESAIESEMDQQLHAVSDTSSVVMVGSSAIPSPAQPIDAFAPLVSAETVARVEQPVLHSSHTSKGPAAIEEQQEPVATLRPRREDQRKESVLVHVTREQNIAPAARPVPQATREEKPPAITRPAQQQTESAEPGQVIFRDRYVPLMSEPRNPSDKPALLPQPPNPIAATVRSDPRRDSPLRPTRPEPDEIEIHIGRIEVAAAPQAPSRSAPRPARKTLTLDDYLKRRHGRPS